MQVSTQAIHSDFEAHQQRMAMHSVPCTDGLAPEDTVQAENSIRDLSCLEEWLCIHHACIEPVGGVTADKTHDVFAIYLASSKAPRCTLTHLHCFQESHTQLECCHYPLAMHVSVSSLQLLGSQLECCRLEVLQQGTTAPWPVVHYACQERCEQSVWI